MTKITCEVTDIEVGYGWLTVWTRQYIEMLDLAIEVYKHLPPEIQQINVPDLDDHNPGILHPYGQGPDTGRVYFKHFHVFLPIDHMTWVRPEHLKNIVGELIEGGSEHIPITNIEEFGTDDFTELDIEDERILARMKYLAFIKERSKYND